MATHVIWADQAPPEAVEAPPLERQQRGWTREAPPHEWFNWHMRRTDTRLADLERPWLRDTLHSPAGTRPGVLRAGEPFAVPEYTVGADRLEIRLDGIPCLPGEAAQYMEVGEAGEQSCHIAWNDDIDASFDILIRAPRKVEAEYVILDKELLDKLPAGAAMLRSRPALPAALPGSGLSVELTGLE